jgi:hypothetical protein
VSREINVAVRSLDSNRVKHLIQLLGTSQGRKATLNKRLVVVHPSEDRAGAFLNLSSQRDVAPKGVYDEVVAALHESGCGVRREKAALSSGCKARPATAPA